MKLDPGIHIAMHSVLSLKPGVTPAEGSAKGVSIEAEIARASRVLGGDPSSEAEIPPWLRGLEWAAPWRWAVDRVCTWASRT